MNIFDYIIVFCIILFVVLLFIMIFIYKLRAKYRRERFLFVSWGAIFNLCIIYLNLLFKSSYPWEVFLKINSDLAEASFATNKASFSDKTLGFLLIIACMWFVNKAYAAWDSTKSEYQKEKEDFGRPSNILIDFIELLNLGRQHKLTHFC